MAAAGMPAGGGGGFLSNIPIIKDIPIIGGLFAKGGVVKGGLQGLPSYANGGVTTQPQLALMVITLTIEKQLYLYQMVDPIPVDLGDQANVQTIGTINILPNANVDKALTENQCSSGWI